MKRIVMGMAAALVAALLAACATTMGGREAKAGPSFHPDGTLVIPADTDQWPTIGITVAMQYEGDVGGQTVNTVRMDPASYAVYRASGVFPAGSMLELEIRRQNRDVEPAREGVFQGALVTHSIHIKDEKAGPGTWTFYGYPPGATAGRPVAREANCYSCHQEHAKDDTVFTQFYPVMTEAHAKAAGG
jgi:hypothetical protein